MRCVYLITAAPVIRKFEEIIKSKKKKNIIWSAYQEAKAFQMFKEKKFANMLGDFGVKLLCLN